MNRDIYIGNGDEQSGPYTEAEIRDFVQSGHVTARSQCWREGMAAWLPAWQMFPNLFSIEQPSAPVSAAQPVSPHVPDAPAMPGSPPPYTLPPPKKRSCCCSGCLILILLIVLIIGGITGVAWYKYRQRPSPVDREYKTIPDYFPPAAGLHVLFPVQRGVK